MEMGLGEALVLAANEEEGKGWAEEEEPLGEGLGDGR